MGGQSETRTKAKQKVCRFCIYILGAIVGDGLKLTAQAAYVGPLQEWLQLEQQRKTKTPEGKEFIWSARG